MKNAFAKVSPAKAAPVKLNSLQDLKAVQKALAEAQARAAAEAAALALEQRRAQAGKELFARAVGAVQPLPDRRKHHPAPVPVEPIPVQRQLDEKAVLLSSLSDGFDASTLLDTDEALSFRRPGIGPDVCAKLRRGDWAIQREIDLHGLRSEEAREALASFIRSAHKQGLRCLRVVHGKGLGSPGKEPVLKSKVASWLIQKNQVLAFAQARPVDGGAGALLVLLAPAPAR